MQARRYLALLLVLCMVLPCVSIPAAAASPLLLDTPTTVTISQPNESMWFSFVPEQTGLYHITSSADAPTFCWLMAADQTVLNFSDGNGETGDFSLKVLLTAGMTYYFDTRYASDTLTGSYEITLTYCGLPSASPLSPGTAASVTLTGDAPAAYYSFTPTQSGQYTLQASSDGDTLCRLYDADWMNIASADDTGEDTDFTLTANLSEGKTYYYEVRYYSNDSGSFEILLTGDGPSVLVPNFVTTVTITDNKPAAYYTFTPTQSGYYALSANSNGMDTICNLYDAEGNYLQESDDSEAGSDFRLVAYLTAGETYCYEVQYYGNGSVGSFEILLTWLGVPDGITLTPGTPATVTVFEGDTSVFCTFTPTESGYYALAANSGGKDTIAWLYDEEGSCLHDNDDSQTGPDFRLVCYLYAGDTYSYEVRYFDPVETGSFEILLTYYPEIVLTPGESATVPTLDTGIVLSCTFTPARTGYYAVTADADGMPVNCILEYAQGNTAHSAENEERDSDTVIKALLIGGDTYRFRFYVSDPEYAGSYDVLLEDLGEPPVTPLTLDQTVSATTKEPAPLYFSFVPPEDGEYRLTLGTEGVTICRLYDANWEQLDSYIHSGESTDVSLTYDLTGGEAYYFEIQDLFGRVRSFDLLLTCPEPISLTPDIPVTVTIPEPGTSVKCTFVPEVSGYYTFASSSGGDTWCHLYKTHNGEQGMVGYDYETYDNSDFSLYYYLIAGEPYIFEVGYSGDGDTGAFQVLLTYSGATTPSGKIANYMVDYYPVSDLILGDDGIYRTPQGSTVYIAIDNKTDGGVFLLDSFTLMDVAMNASEYLDLTYWDALTARMDENGYVVLTEETLEYVITTITGNPELGITAEYAVFLFFYDYPPVDSEPEEDTLLGDVTGDGIIDTADAYYIVLYYNERKDLTDKQLAAADVDGNGTVDTADAYYIVLYYNERIDAFPANSN